MTPYRMGVMEGDGLFLATTNLCGCDRTQEMARAVTAALAVEPRD